MGSKYFGVDVMLARTGTYGLPEGLINCVGAVLGLLNESDLLRAFALSHSIQHVRGTFERRIGKRGLQRRELAMAHEAFRITQNRPEADDSDPRSGGRAQIV